MSFKRDRRKKNNVKKKEKNESKIDKITIKQHTQQPTTTIGKKNFFLTSFLMFQIY
jgi:hypothetical protein